MALNQSTIRWFDAPSCKVTPKGHPSADGLLHLNYSMQNNSFADVLRLGALCKVAENRASRLIARNGFAKRAIHMQFTKNSAILHSVGYQP
jgi:hypothetical protein